MNGISTCPSDDYITKYWSKIEPKKHFLKQTDKLYSRDTLSLLLSEKKSFLSEIDVSEISQVKESKFKKPIKRSFSFSNILPCLNSDDEVAFEQKDKTENIVTHHSFNYDSLNDCNKLNEKNDLSVDALKLKPQEMPGNTNIL